MKITKPEPVFFNKSISETFDLLYGKDLLKNIHGEDGYKASEWQNGKRKIEYMIRINNIPKELKRLICGDDLRITSRQTLKNTGGALFVLDKLKMHFVGSELFIVRPKARLEEINPRGTLVSIEIESHALFPPPLCNIIEGFMDMSAKCQIQNIIAHAQTPIQADNNTP